MHHVANYEKASFQVPPAYEKLSQGYSRIALVDHTIAGAVHTGLVLCKLESSSTLNLHVHFYEEAFFLLEGQVLERSMGMTISSVLVITALSRSACRMPCATLATNR